MAAVRPAPWPGLVLALALFEMDGLGTRSMAEEGSDTGRLQRECGLYRRLLDLGRTNELEPFLREALGLIVEVTGARQGYLELSDDQSGTPQWSLAHGFSAGQLEGVRAAMSRGII